MTPDAIDYAFRRIEAFAQVHEHDDIEGVQEAFGYFLNSFGVTDEARERLNERMADYNVNPLILGFMVLGVTIGLGITEFEHDRV